MYKRYHIHEGIHVASIIAIVTAVPRFIRFSNSDLINIFEQMCYSAVFSLILWIICQHFIDSKSITKKAQKIGFALLSGTIISVVLQLLSYHLFKDFGVDNERLRIAFHYNHNQQTFLYFFKGIMFSSLIYFIANTIKLVEERQKTQLELEQLKQENLEARLGLLKQQVSPHFLFNSLSTLKTMATDSKTKKFVLQLSNVYRYLLKDNNIQNLVSLKDELAFTESYLYIIKERFEDALIVSTTINEELLNKRLPPLVLQILIENAIKHNILTAEEPLKITIFTDKYQSLTVENILQPKQSTEDSLGIGLENIKGRYKLIGDKEIKILQTQHSFSVTVPLLD